MRVLNRRVIYDCFVVPGISKTVMYLRYVLLLAFNILVYIQKDIRLWEQRKFDMSNLEMLSYQILFV